MPQRGITHHLFRYLISKRTRYSDHDEKRHGDSAENNA